MPTDGAIDVVVFEPQVLRAEAASAPSWRSARTTRALARLGLVPAVVLGETALCALLAARTAPVWLLVAGAAPLGSPRLPPPSATGRWLLALGAIQDDARWRVRLAETGGSLPPTSEGLPRVCSVFLEKPAALAEELASPGTSSPPRTDALSAACSRLVAVARAVRLPAFDVAFTDTAHVLELVTTLHRGGAERVVLDLVRELDRLGVDATLAVLDRASRTTFEAPPGTVFLDEHADGRAERLAALVDLAAAIGADLIHAHLVNGEDLRIIARSGIPIVTTIHNSQPGWPIKLDALAAGDLALVIACSRDVERQLLAAGVPGPVRTVWNGITNTRPPDIPPVIADTIRMLVIANHRPQKRLERLPTMVAELRTRGREARVLIVGEPVKGDPAMVAIELLVRAEARRLGVTDFVKLVGSMDDVAPLYAAHDVVISTSAFEGLSLVYLEALAAGLPIVTTAVAGTDELARKHPHAHVVALDARPAAFGDAVIAAVEHAKTSPDLGLALDFTAAKMAERHADLFARVLAARPARPRSGLVLIGNNFSTGGAQSSARRLLVALSAAGIPVRAIVLQEQVSFPTAGRAALTEAGIEVVVAPRAGDVDPIVTARAIASTVDAWNPQALLFWNVISQHKVLIADLLFDTPIWDVSPGEMYFASFENYLTKPRVGSPYLTMADYGRRLSGVIVKYEAERSRAEQALGVRVDVVPNGVEVPTALPSRPGGATTVIGTLARLGVDKKLEQLIDAVKHAYARGLFDGCELRIAGAAETGDDAYEQALRARAEGLPITFVGEQEATPFLAQLDLFAMVSEPSGCPNASIEAMAAGLAVVATDAGGARDQIVHGETGLLVPRGDAASLGEAIAELAHDRARREAFGRAGHQRVLARYDVKRMARDYARICLGDEASLAALTGSEGGVTSSRSS